MGSSYISRSILSTRILMTKSLNTKHLLEAKRLTSSRSGIGTLRLNVPILLQILVLSCIVEKDVDIGVNRICQVAPTSSSFDSYPQPVDEVHILS